MDFDLNSSDFEFPSDTGLSKLSSPLSFKVPESRDWALDEFMQTLSSKPCMEADNLTSFKQYIPVQKGDDEFNCGPPKISLSFFEEKDFLSQMSQRFLDLERNELLDILKGGFSLVQNDIQTNSGASPFTSLHPDINWFDEALDYGHRTTSTIGDLNDIEIKRVSGFSPFAPRHQSVHESEIDEDLIPPPFMEINKPLPALPPVLPITTTTLNAADSTTNKKKGLKYKLKSKLIKSFTPTTNKKNFLSNTKKFITKIFPTKNAAQ